MSGAPKPSTTYATTGFFVLRTPHLPFEVLERWSEGLAAPALRSDDPGLAEAMARDEAILTERLRELAGLPVVREALFCASPSLDDALEAWLRDPASPRARGVVTILVRYLARMTTRPTPFGLFSGTSVGEIGDETRLELGPRESYRRHGRLDMDYICRLIETLEADEALRDELVYRPSSGLYRAAGQLRYAEARRARADGARSYHLVSVATQTATRDRAGAERARDPVEVALDRAASGARLGDIARAIAEADPEVELEEARRFAGELVDAQILVSNLAPALTGREPIHSLLESLGAAAPAHPVVSRLEAARDRLASLDERGLGVAPREYRDLARSLAELPARPDLSRLFQIDLHKPAPSARLGGAPLAELHRALGVLHKVFARPSIDPLDAFRAAFERRYGAREIPLVEALDDDRGIGFGGSADPSPLLADLPLGARAVQEAVPFARRDRWLLARTMEVLGRGERELRLDERDLEELASDAAPFPESFAIYAFFAARSADALARGDFRARVGVWGPGAVAMLARFCHADRDLARRVELHLRAEEALHPDAIFAEIVHLPEGRLGNVLCRPCLRDHEIPYLCRSSAPDDRQIPIEDLTLSLRGRRLVLRSRRLGREVIPRLTNAHAFSTPGLSIYRFLASLQLEDQTAGFGWEWGALGAAPALPRVTYGRLVLSLARWTVSGAHLRALQEGRAAARFQAARALRDELLLPRYVTLGSDDQTLLIDLDNVLSVETFAALVKGAKSVVLHEMFPGPDELCAVGPEGRFVHEVLVPVVAQAPRVARQPSSPATSASPERPAKRAFPPGSEWLYAKLYAGKNDVDVLLRGTLGPLIRRAEASGDLDRWFFVRYADPDWHLRVRWRGPPDRLCSRLLPALRDAVAPLIERGIVHRLALDTYEREIERYGGPRGIELAEALFHADSEAALDIVTTFSGDEGADARWRLALLGMHRLLDDLGLDLARRIALLRELRARFGEEHRVGPFVERQLGARYRPRRLELEALLVAADTEHPLERGIAALARRSTALAPICAALRAADRAGELDHPLTELTASYLHMHPNRVLVSEQRAHELVLYDWLLRMYESRRARQRSILERL